MNGWSAHIINKVQWSPTEGDGITLKKSEKEIPSERTSRIFLFLGEGVQESNHFSDSGNKKEQCVD